ncbi:DnaJ domain-containing protein [Sphaerospermopsis aphanizomenoides BCCUSP55]|uniref:J domain-containing protein n=1 Tax=Sphaerospermopsis aphanizomenoides TaxID=459663 RepID=UPI000AD86DCF|nr:DnaJ domain-containing protein [Sphaerospermopsis aphanizomenoides]MBK1990794.1 DnaJ domain-containing protein [Sphaerospermopsis aphanizomenoides BCCUSP55]
MSQNFLPPEILELLVDPYAVLGVSVNADERQISKRYHALAKQLHPDNYVNIQTPDKDLARIILTRLINPAYQQLKQEKKRLDTVSTLRLKARSLNPQVITELQKAVNMQIIPMSAQEADFFYEQAIASCTETQYKSLQKSHQVTRYISKLNLVYLSLPKHNTFETQTITTELKSTASKSIVPRPEIPKVTFQLSEDKNSKATPINYAQRHYERAVQYGQQSQWALAVKELRDAIKLEPNNSDHYALLGVVHFQQNFPGMAKVYIRQALKLNPKHPLALKYAALLKIEAIEQSPPKSMGKALGIARLLSRFLSGHDS